MDINIVKAAGYSILTEEYRKRIELLEWDDDYDLIHVGSPLDPKDQFYSSINNGWSPNPWAKGRKIPPTDCIYRRLKPGLEIIRVKE